MKYASITDKGRVRSLNQDNYSNLITKDFSLFIVADGMGGHKAGEVASKIAVETIRDYIFDRGPREDYSDLLENAVIYANNKILEMARLNPDYSNMGTTIVCVLLANERAYIAHLGDSRLYHFTEGKLRQVTRDDSYVQSLIDTGITNINQELLDSYKSVVTKALGLESSVEINLDVLLVKPDDYLVLVTDGLTNLVDDTELEEVINLDLDIKEASEILVYMANSSGGFDNITVTLVKI